MKTCIIIEGCDFAGKSTIAQELFEAFIARRLNTGVVHNGPLPADVRNAADYYLSQIMQPPYDITIYDRHAAGERIYGPLFRGVDALRDDGWQIIQHADYHFTGRLFKIFVDPPNAILRERFRGTRGDDLITKEDQLISIAEQYRDLLGNAPGWVRWSDAVKQEVLA